MQLQAKTGTHYLRVALLAGTTALCLSASRASAADAATPSSQRRIDITKHAEILEEIDVAPVWAVHPPGAPQMITRDGFQYITYFDGDGYLAVAQRKLPSKQWTFYTFPVRTGWATTGHGQITLALDRDGYVHISAYRRMLAEAPPAPPEQIYYRSTKPRSVEAFDHLHMISPKQKVAYPRFIMAGDNLYYQFRDGGSGGGNYAYYAYNADEKTWRVLSGKAILNGRGKMSPYASLDPGPDGFWHLRWVWRNDPGNHSNHSASYARSKDMENWETAAGEPLKLPITSLTEGVVIDPATKPMSGISNKHQGGLGFDSKMRPILSYHKFDENKKSQVYNARWEGDHWNIVKATDWDFKWNYAGTGTKSSVLGHGNVTAGDKPGTLHHRLSSNKHGKQLIILDEATLAPLETRDIKDPAWIAEIHKPESDFKARKLSVIICQVPPYVVGDAEEKGVRYIFRWERGNNNRDRPVSKPWPEPTMLRVYKIKSDM